MEMAQWRKCLQHKDEDQSVDPPGLKNGGQAWQLLLVPARRRQKQGIPEQTDYLEKPQLTSSGSFERPYFKSGKWLKKTPTISFGSLYAHSAPTHMQTHIQTHESNF